jgi:hypothetical protein
MTADNEDAGAPNDGYEPPAIESRVPVEPPVNVIAVSPGAP